MTETLRASVDLHYKSRLTAREQKVFRLTREGKLQAGKLTSYISRKSTWRDGQDFTFRVLWGTSKAACQEGYLQSCIDEFSWRFSNRKNENIFHDYMKRTVLVKTA